MTYWDDYYIKTPEDKTPWTGVNTVFFDKLWDKFNLPKSGNLLDIGCGRGDKSIYFAQKGFKVWGFDISETAIQEAKKKTQNLENKPNFFVADAANFENYKDNLGNNKFDVVLDLLVTQFLDKDQKVNFITGLKDNLSNKSYYILNTFIKDSENDPMEGYEEWVKKIAQTPRDIEEIYLKDFELIDKFEKTGTKGKTGIYVLKKIERD